MLRGESSNQNFSGSITEYTCKGINAFSCTVLEALLILIVNFLQEEKDCAYYMRTGSCKYGVTCKFHHPQPAAMGALVSMSGSSLYATPATQSSSTPQPHPAGPPSWPIAARAPYLQVPSTFAPVIVPPLQGVVSMTGWNTYQVSLLILHKDVKSCPPIYVFFWSVQNKLFV